MICVLHFADAHIDIANYGRHDPETNLPIRVEDFLRSLDQIVETAIDTPAELVIFAGDAYKDRNPQPTFQRAWGERLMHLSKSKIPTILLIGNHDKSPATERATTVQEFKTLDVPYIYVADNIGLLGPDQLSIPVQVITIPWISRSALMAREESAGKSVDEVLQIIESRLALKLEALINEADPDLPLILTAHASIQGASYSSERVVMLGNELVLSESLVRDERLDYVALGHIHKHQSLNGGRHPPVVYPGSIERIDFGETREPKGFVLANVSRGKTDWQFIELSTRPYVDITIELSSADSFMHDLMGALPDTKSLTGAVCRLQINYPRDWEPLLDEPAIAAHFSDALSFQLVKNRTTEKRSRLGDVVEVEKLSPEELLEQYWITIGLEADEIEAMQGLAKEVLFDHQRLI